MASGGHASGDAVLGTVVTFSLLSYICVALRIWTRFKIQRSPGIDDVLIVISTGFNIVMCLCMIMQVHYGLGKHIEKLSPYDLENLLFWFWLSIWTYYGAQGFGKLSILFQYIRIFGRVDKFRKICYWSIALCVFYILWGVITSIVICAPVSGFWHFEWQHNGKAKCLPKWRVKIPIWFFNAAMNMTTDVLIAVIPLPVIKTLQLPKKQRYMLMGVFCLGGVVCIISIVRLSGLYAIAISEDPSYDNPLAALWSATEANFTAIASCLPVIKGWQSAKFPNLFGSSAPDSRNISANTDTIGSGPKGRIWGKRETRVEVRSAPTSPVEAPREEDWAWSGRVDSTQGGGMEMQSMEGAANSTRPGSVDSREAWVTTDSSIMSNRGAWREGHVGASEEVIIETQPAAAGHNREASQESQEILVPISPLCSSKRGFSV